MSNPFVLLTVFFATVSTILLYALIAYHDTNKQLRAKVNHLWRVKLATDAHLDACSELLHYAQELERRNEALESCQNTFRNTFAGCKLMMPSIVDERERFVVRTGEAP